MESSEDKFYPCDYCQKKFKFSKTLSLHTRRVHEGSRPHKCGTCGRVFNKSRYLISHMRNHTGEKPYICYLCDMSFTVACNLRRHVKRKHLKPNAKGTPIPADTIKCHVQSKNQLNSNADEKPKQPVPPRRHVQGHLQPQPQDKPEKIVVLLENGQKRYKCAACNKLFTQNSNLNRHMIVHTGYKPHECNFCGYAFTKKMTLDSHVLKSHSEPKVYPCRFCKKSYSKDSALRSHLRKHGEDLYICSVCSYSTYEKDRLKKHERSHCAADGDGVNPKLSPRKSIGGADVVIKSEADSSCACELCPSPKYFIDTDDLEAHLMSFHIEPEDAMHEYSSCDYTGTCQESENEEICDSEKTSQKERMRQAELIPEDITTQAGEKRYRCRLCGKIYAHNYYLESHMRASH